MNPDGKTRALGFLSYLKAELDVQEFERTRERRRQRHAAGERNRHWNKTLHNQITGVINVPSQVTAL